MTSEEDCALTVVMPVFNALPYLDAAIASIVGQTFADFRFVIYDDHSTDGSYERAQDWAARDPRIMVSRGASRLGPCGSSNAAAALAQTPLVARMDADDVAMPERLERQRQVMRDRPGAVLVGSTYEIIDGKGMIVREASQMQSRRGNPHLTHPSIMYRRASFIQAGGYRESTDYFEDYDLYVRLAALGELLVLDQPLIRVRFAGQHARLLDDRDYVLDQLSNRNGIRPRAHSARRNITPGAFRSLTSLAVHSLQRSGLLSTMIRQVDLSRPLAVVPTFFFVMLAEISPVATLRLSKFWAKARNVMIRPHHVPGGVLQWTLPG